MALDDRAQQPAATWHRFGSPLAIDVFHPYSLKKLTTGRGCNVAAQDRIETPEPCESFSFAPEQSLQKWLDKEIVRHQTRRDLSGQTEQMVVPYTHPDEGLPRRHADTVDIP